MNNNSNKDDNSQEEDFKDQPHVGWDVMGVDVDLADRIVLPERSVVVVVRHHHWQIVGEYYY